MSLHSIKSKSSAFETVLAMSEMVLLLNPSRIRPTKSWIWTLLSPFGGNLAFAMPMKLPQQSSGIGSAVLPRKLTANILEMDGLKWTIFLDRFSHLYESIQYQCYHDCHSCRLAFQQLRITRSGQRLLSALILLRAPSKTNLLTRALWFPFNISSGGISIGLVISLAGKMEPSWKFGRYSTLSIPIRQPPEKALINANAKNASKILWGKPTPSFKHVELGSDQRGVNRVGQKMDQLI